MVNMILPVVAKDKTIDQISKMVKLNTVVYHCVRKTNESLNNYINRFRIPALGYQNMVQVTYDSSESQIFAMELIIIAKLGQQNNSTITSYLISNTESKPNQYSDTITLSKSRV